jgi:hypothetical protein
MTEQDKPNPDSAAPQLESKPKPARKSKQKKANKKPKRDSHACRPRSTISYWIEGIENRRFKGAELVLAIERVEAHEKDKERKKLEKSKPITGNVLRTILNRTPSATAPKVESQPVAQIAKDARLRPVEPPAPEITETPAEQTLSFEDFMAEISKPSGKTPAEEIAEIAARLRDVPAPEPDAATKSLIQRAWSKTH